MDTIPKRAARLVVLAAGATAGTGLGWALFVAVPAGDPTVLGVVLTLASALVILRASASVADSLLGAYDTAEIPVDGPIARDGGDRLPGDPRRLPADAVVEQVERADADSNTEALLVRLNTPGGEVVPSDDIRQAVADFDGPTVAYATDVCASGGYWIASACDHVVARETSVVGSIGVRGSTLNATGLAEKLGVDYERFVAGEYKDAGNPLRDLDEDERAYLQGIVDDLYDEFVDRVADGRDLSPDDVRDTEARVYVGSDAASAGLVDELGTRDAAEDYLASALGHDVRVREFEPPRGLFGRVRTAAAEASYAFGAGVGSAVRDDDASRFRFR
ncbi:MAG: signal peptide peptidase SppA [Halobacterium sp.]